MTLRIATLVLASWIATAAFGNALVHAAGDASEPAPAPPAPQVTETAVAPPLSAEAVAELIQKLSGNDFAERKQATTALIQGAQSSVDAVARAADADDLEVAARCIAVLAELHKSKDPATQKAAQQALERLTKSERRSVAQRAAKVLAPPEVAAPQPGRLVLGNAVGRRVLRLNARQANGKKHIEAEEDGRKVQIDETPADGITVQVTETVNGEQKTSVTRAKDAETLKKEQPAVYKLYEKYVPKGAPVEIELQAVPAGPPLPIGPAIPAAQLRRVLVPARLGDVLKELGDAQQRLEKATAQIEKLAADKQADTAEFQDALKELKAAVQQLSETQARLPK